MARIYFSLGSNQGERLDSLVKATMLINSLVGKVVNYSAVYESEPWGFQADTTFYNQVIEVETRHNPWQVLDKILAIEKTMGRIRSGKEYSSRIIDIDILFYEAEIIKSKELEIPHPKLHLRRFVIEPLVAVAPELIHPGLKIPVSEILIRLGSTDPISVAVNPDEFALELEKSIPDLKLL